MKKINRIKTIALIMLCVPFCGGWTEAPNEQEERYGGGELIATYATETVPYVSKQIIDVTTANGAPDYSAGSNLQNGCGAVAGSVVVGFYDKYYENMITDWESYYSSGIYKFEDGTYVPALMKELYGRMFTNLMGIGVSQAQFKYGLRTYVESKGYNLEYVSLGNGDTFDYSAFKTAVSNNEVTVLFVKPSDLYEVWYYTNEDGISTVNISGNHVMVAYGYYEVTYTLSDGGTRTDKYLCVSTGLLGTTLALYKVGSYVTAAYVVKII